MRSGHFESWTASGWSSERWQQGPGQVDRIWILDVQGQRLVIDAGYMPSATTAERAELNCIVHSIRILNPTAENTSSASVVTGRFRAAVAVRSKTASGSPIQLRAWATGGT